MQRIENRWPGRACRALAIGAVALGCSGFALAQNASTVPATATGTEAPAQGDDVAAIRKALGQKFPGAQISHVAKSGYFGLYEVMLDDNLIYTDPSAADTTGVAGAVDAPCANAGIVEQPSATMPMAARVRHARCDHRFSIRCIRFSR